MQSKNNGLNMLYLFVIQMDLMTFFIAFQI